MLDGVLEAAEALAPEDVSRDADDEDVVRLLPQHELERHARIGAADDRCEGDVRWRERGRSGETDVVGADRGHVTDGLPLGMAP